MAPWTQWFLSRTIHRSKGLARLRGNISIQNSRLRSAIRARIQSKLITPFGRDRRLPGDFVPDGIFWGTAEPTLLNVRIHTNKYARNLHHLLATKLKSQVALWLTRQLASLSLRRLLKVDRPQIRHGAHEFGWHIANPATACAHDDLDKACAPTGCREKRKD